MIVDWSLIITLGVVFLITLTGAWLRSRRKDECLQAFDGFHVTLQRDDGRIIWGTMHVEPTGLEFQYREAIQDEDHIEASYVLYKDEFGAIQAIYRFADDLDDENKDRRAKQLRTWFNPGPFRLFGRRVRNFLSTASESLNEVIGILVGQARKPAAKYITDTSEAYLKRFGSDIIGHAGSRHDPLLERFIGQRVVFEFSEDGEVHEHVGIFKNYSADFLEILDVQFPVREKLQLNGQDPAQSWGVTAVMEEDGLIVKNACDYPVLIQRLRGPNGEEQLLDIVVDASEQIVLHPRHPFDVAELNIKIVRELDILAPRTRCLIRHRAAQIKTHHLPDIIFDLGVVLRTKSRDEAREQRLREALAADPLDPQIAANLGALLIRKGEFDEAEEHLQRALSAKDSLADRGRRIGMELRELSRRRRRASEGELWASSVHSDLSSRLYRAEQDGQSKHGEAVRNDPPI